MLLISAVALPIGLYGRFNSWNIFNETASITSLVANHFGTKETMFWFAIYLTTYAMTHLFVEQAAHLSKEIKGDRLSKKDA